MKRLFGDKYLYSRQTHLVFSTGLLLGNESINFILFYNRRTLLWLLKPLLNAFFKGNLQTHRVPSSMFESDMRTTRQSVGVPQVWRPPHLEVLQTGVLWGCESNPIYQESTDVTYLPPGFSLRTKNREKELVYCWKTRNKCVNRSVHTLCGCIFLYTASGRSHLSVFSSYTLISPLTTQTFSDERSEMSHSRSWRKRLKNKYTACCSVTQGTQTH